MSSKLSKNALLSVGQTIAAAALLVLLYRAMVNELGLELALVDAHCFVFFW
jgi:hypothetical protein